MTTQVLLYNEDCIAGMAKRLNPESIDLTVTSIPFEELFTYSGKLEDVGNNGSTINIREGRFALNLRFVIAQLLRVHKPGTNVCVHIQQLLAYKNQHGFIGRRDFRGAVIDLFSAGGFDFKGEFIIPKNPQAMAQRLNLHCLMFQTGYTNAANLAPAPNDYVLVFQKPGEIAVPVPALYHKEKNPTGWVTTNDWVRDAHGVWSDISEVDVLDGYRAARESDQEKHVCLARGSLVLTRNGYLPIEEIEIGDLVLTHRGRWRPVTAKACNGVLPVTRITAQGVADLRTTPDHLFWVRSCAGRGGKGREPGSMNPHRHRYNAEKATPTWMQAKDTLGSYVNLPLPPVEDSPYSAEEWWIAGRWLGDGHYAARNALYISCAHKETSELVSKLGSRAGSIATRRTATQIRLKDRNGRLHSLLAKCGRGAAGKRVPAEALALDAEKSEAFLSGYLSADGHYTAKYDRWSATSVSRSLLLGMAMVAQRARGVVCSVYAGRRGGQGVIEGREVKTLDEWVLSIPPKNVSGFLLDDGAWKKVRDVQEDGEAEVWDIQVAEDESFTAEGCVVHNCPLQLEVIRRLVLLYTNPISVQPDVTVLDPFGGIMSTPYICVELDRNAIAFELKESYYHQGVRNVELARKLKVRQQAALFDYEGSSEVQPSCGTIGTFQSNSAAD